jgi:uncharacterized protein (TIGR02594 family)
MLTPAQIKEAFVMLQSALHDLGYPVGKIDGVFGPKTRGGMAALMEADGKPGSPITHGIELPWVSLGRLMLGLHETRDKAKLAEFLKSDGATLGDPAVLPWCGDFIETCIKRTLPDELFPSALAANPYWAKNWALLGKAVAPTYGAIMAFERPGGGGHVGICLGQDGENFVVLGGNQSNSVSITKIAKSRLLKNGARWPSTFDERPTFLPVATVAGAVSINEA